MTEKANNTRRRIVLQTGLGMLAAGAGMAIGSAKAAPITVADDKLAHDLVQYQEMPKDGAMCSKCAQFVAPNACNIVASPINPNGWCVAYAPKEG
jgi:hypothetical protein